MRRSEREIAGRAGIEEVLRAAHVCFLGINDGRTPYVVPMNFGYRENALYLHSAVTGRKVEALRRNGRVSFVVVADADVNVDPEIACNGSATYRSVMGVGTAQLLEAPDEKERGLDVLMAQLGGPTGPYQPQSLANTLVIRVDIESMTGKAARPD